MIASRLQRLVVTLAAWLLAVWVTLPGLAITMAPRAYSDAPDCSQRGSSQTRAELFATDNTDIITDPEDSRLRDPLAILDITVGADISIGGASSLGSALVDGLFWSDRQQRLTYERSRDFELCVHDEGQLHNIADEVAHQFRQESVLTFEHLPPEVQNADAVELRVPEANIARFASALASDARARVRLHGGSLTEDRTLILIVARDDVPLASRILKESLQPAPSQSVVYGKREFVE